MGNNASFERKLEKIARTNISESIAEIKGRDVYVWGTGKMSEITTNILGEYNIGIAGYIDGDESKAGKLYNGKTIAAPIEIKDKSGQIFVYVASSYVEEVSKSLALLNFTAKDRCLAALDYKASLNIELTTRCNLKCEMCTFRAFGLEKRDMSVDESKNVIDASNAEGIGCVIFCGRGENLVHPNYTEIINYAADKFDYIQMINNAIGFDDKVADAFLEIDEPNLRFSITGFSADVYNRFQGSGCKDSSLRDKAYNNVLRLIEKRKAKGVKAQITLIYILTDDNIEDFKEYASFWEDKIDADTDEISVSCLGVLYGYAADSMIKKSVPQRCSQYGRLFVYNDGSVVLCCMHNPDIIGNLNEQSFSDILNSEKYTKFRHAMMYEEFSELPECCKKCARLYENLYTSMINYVDIKAFLSKAREVEDMAMGGEVALLGVSNGMTAFLKAMDISGLSFNKSVYDLFLFGGSYERESILMPDESNLSNKTVLVFDGLQKKTLLNGGGDFGNTRFIDFYDACE